jgi:hypothetical protein
MFSTRNAFAILCSILVWSLAGCGFQSARNNPRPDPVNDSPLIVDEAMQQRNFERSSAYYQRSTVVAGPTWLTFRGDEKAERTDLITDPMIFLTNVAVSPYAAVRDPQWKAVEYQGASVPPTHHAMPPLPE